MIYTDQTKLAMKIAFEAHKEHLDKTGMPYIYHPFYLATQMDTEETTTVALLHDVIEDSDLTLSDLRQYGFSETILRAVELLTHAEDVPYFDYVENLKSDPIARTVKRADLLHNSDITRYDHVDENIQSKLEKYARALRILEE